MTGPVVRSWIGCELDRAEVVEAGPGTVVVFTRRRPDKEGPNEDAALVAERDGWLLLAVADGAGGMRGGAEASRIAVESLVEAFLEGDGEGRSRVVDGLERAHERIVGLGIGAATTTAAVLLCEGRVRSFHVGDSTVLVCGQRGRRKLQTVSHSPVGYAVEAGLLDEKEALRHRDRHLVSNLLGVGDPHIELGGEIRLAPRDTVIVASDGLFDNFLVEEVVEHVRTGKLDRRVDGLVDEALRRMREPRPGTPSKPDDLSVVAFRRARR